MEYFHRWDKNFRYFDNDWLRTKFLTAYFHAFFTPPKECVTLFLKTVRTSEEDIYYDMKTVSPKIISTSLKSLIDKRSICCKIEMNALDVQDDNLDRLSKEDVSEVSQEDLTRNQRRNDNDDGLKRNAMLENTRILQSQLNELKSKQRELTSEIRMLKNQNNQMLQQCERLKEEKDSLVKEKKSNQDATKEKTELLNKSILQLRNAEIAHSEATARVKDAEKEVKSLKQENQSLNEKVDSLQFSRWKYLAVGVVLGVLSIVGLLKFLTN